MSTVSVPATSHGGPQSRVDRIVMHATVSSCRDGGAVANARYLNTVGLSAHYLVDPSTIAVMLGELTIGYHDGHNTNEVGIELCDWQSGPASRWSDAAHTAMLALAAPLVRGICQRHNVPMTRIHAPLGTQRGVCGHVDITNTPGFTNSSHTDPDVAGPFPWEAFMALVVGSPTQEVDMTPAELFAATIKTGRETVTVAQILARVYTMAEDNQAAIKTIQAEVAAIKTKTGA